MERNHMSVSRRSLIATAAFAAMSRASIGGASQGIAPLSGLWRSRSTAELLAFTDDSYRRYTSYSNALALIDRGSKTDFQEELLGARGNGPDGLELEHWGPVTRMVYDRSPFWPPVPRFGGDEAWSTDPRLVVEAFFEILVGHYAFAIERGVDWPSLRADCDATLPREATSPGRLFDALARVMKHLQDGHGSLRMPGEHADSITATPQVVADWSAAAGKSSDGDAWSGLMRDGLAHVKRRVLRGTGNADARDNLLWGRTERGLGYLALMSCEGIAEDDGGSADVAAITALLNRAVTDLEGVPGLIVDLRFNDGGWDRVALELARHFTDKVVPAFTKQPVRSGLVLPRQLVEITPARGCRYTGPVAVLTSGITISAAEVGVLGLRALPNTRSFGQPTYGALSDELSFRLPNGWRGTLSNEIYRSLDGQVYESVGIPPHLSIAAPSTGAFWQTFDMSLSEAERWLRGN
jgi:hypothetical protein